MTGMRGKLGFILAASALHPFSASASMLPPTPLAERVSQADTIFIGTITNRVVEGDWVRAELIVDSALMNAEQGKTIAVTWRLIIVGGTLVAEEPEGDQKISRLKRVGGKPAFDAPSGSRGIAILKGKHKGRYWLRGDKFENLDKLAHVKKLIKDSHDSLPSGADEMPRGHYTLTGVEVVPINRSIANGKINYSKSDTLTHSVRFDIRAMFTLKKDSKTKPFQITNPTIPDKCSLTVDQPIMFKGKEISSGTNLMKFKHFDGSFLNISMPSLSPLVINSIRIRDDFHFPADTYTLKFQWETKDGTTISDTVTVRIDIGSVKKAKPPKQR